MNKTAKEIVISEILENSNGSWKDMVEDGYDAGFEAATTSQQPVPQQTEVGGWVSVEDDLPLVYGTRVLCFTNTGKLEVGYLSDGIWARDNGHYFSGHGYTVTHWQSLPSPPLNK